MAKRRMFSLEIIDTDIFLDMPQSSQNLYFHLGMRADDDGFVSNPKKIMKIIGATEDDHKILIMKQFIIPYETGICVIKHWKIHNYIQIDRYKETIYREEKSQLSQDINGTYTKCIQDVSNMDTQVRLGKVSLDKDSIDKVIYKDIISFLNETCNKNYKDTTPKTRELIKVRIKEGYTVDDFKTVISKKAQDKYFIENDYLRPETLFSNKFESYLNENKRQIKKLSDVNIDITEEISKMEKLWSKKGIL